MRNWFLQKIRRYVPRQRKTRQREARAEELLLGSTLRELRQARDVPLRIVAAAAEMDSTLLSKVELNQRLPTRSQTAALAKFYGVACENLEAKRIATKFWKNFGRSAAADQAVLLLRKQTGHSKIWRGGSGS